MSSTALARKIVERTIGEKVISLETGLLAKQASGAVVVRIGDTMSLVATMAAPGREGLDFFPLTVDYREKTYAAGKFPGGFIKREGRPTTKEILTARLIDRPIRPLFPEWYREEVQIQAGPISADRQNDPDVPSMIGASASLLLTKAPFQGPIGAVRLARVEGKLVAFPTAEELEKSDLDLIVASTTKAVVMIEGFGEELPEPEMADAIMPAHRLNQEVIQLQFDLLEAVGLPIPEHVETPADPLRQLLYDRYADRLREIKQIVLKQERNGATKDLLDQVIKDLIPADGTPLAVPTGHVGESGEAPVEVPVTPGRIKAAFSAVEERVVRELILEGKRPDGRGPRDLRAIRCEVSLLPRAHGSALFQRGETQALVTTVLGTAADEQRVDGIMDEYSKKFMLDYNMPPFAVGEIRPIRGPGRREIGHGALAERSVAPILPSPAKFPYTIRVISDILESNGSSSMASVCGATLSLMDAGVPISDPVGGISIGLVQDEASGRHILLTDIIGDEDHFGDMDFKVAGTQRGVTGIQLDLKNKGITEEIIRETLEQAHEARAGNSPGDAAGDQAAARGDLRQRAAADPDPDQSREDRPDHRPRRQDDPPAPGRDRRQDRHRGQRGRHPLQPGSRGGRGRPRQDRGHDRGGPDRPDLRGPGHLDQGVRRLRRDPSRQGRPGPHQRAVRRLCLERDGHLPGRRSDAGQGHRRGRPGPRQAVAQGRPGRTRRARRVRVTDSAAGGPVRPTSRRWPTRRPAAPAFSPSGRRWTRPGLWGWRPRPRRPARPVAALTAGGQPRGGLVPAGWMAGRPFLNPGNS